MPEHAVSDIGRVVTSAVGSSVPAPGRQVVELACQAPSVDNSQPWRWRVRDAAVELHADRARRRETTDPHGRNLAMSCGAALHHAEVAAAALGWPALVERAPDRADPDHLATLHLRRGVTTPDARAALEALLQRCTDRRRFTSWPVPEERLADLAASARVDRVRVLPLTEAPVRVRVERLVDRAGGAAVAGAAHHAHPGLARGAAEGLLVVLTDTDTPADWLRAGEALSQVWLAATVGGLSVVPESRVVDDDTTRRELHHEVLGGLAEPQLLLRIGWQQLGRRGLARTSRRPVADVLLP